jgi:tetratricopeptide (TPR) repeat protein
MTPERWRAITAVFNAALARDAADRDAFVADCCADDGALRRDVDAMLAAHAEAEARGESAGFSPERVLAALAASTGEPASQLTLSSTAPASETAQPPGDLLAGRYRVLRFIGRGGMGAVYEARDEVIDDVIAVKVVGTGGEPVEALEARWRREALLARKVSHGGVCRVHDVAIHRRDDRTWLLLTMERVNGESLRSRLRRGSLPLEEGLSIVRQVAAALDAAHAQGVLHRDVKPENILLEPREGGGVRAVLTDFGLARDVRSGTALTAAGRIAGTAGYLAPELLRGEPPSVKSDLYAFAMSVHALAGRTEPGVPPRAEAVLARGLSPEPHDRFASALEFADALAAAMQPVPLWRERWTRRRVAAAAAAVVVVALTALATATVWSYREATATIAPASQVLLASVTNGTNDPELDGAGEVLRSQLAQSPHFELLEPERIQAALTRMALADRRTSSPEVAREVALREGVPLVVYAALTRLGADYTMSIRLEHVGPRPTFARRSWTESFDAPTKAGLFEAMHGAAVWIRQMAGELPDALDRQDRAASETTTTSWEALRLFAQAADLQVAGRVQDATLVLEQAVRIDPDFAMAHARLGDYLISLRRHKEGFAAWEQAIAAAERRQLTSREALRIRAQYLGDTGDLAGAEKAYRTYALQYPNDFQAAFYVGASLKDLNRVEEAVPWLERALKLRPTSMVAAVHLAGAYLDLGRTADAARATDYVASIGASDWFMWLRALSLFAELRPDGALAALEPLRGSRDPSWPSRAHTIRASWLSEIGRDGDAMAELRAGIEHDTTLGLRDRLADKWLHLADLQRRAGDPEALVSVQRSVETAINARRLQKAVGILVGAGHRADAERLMAHFDALPAVPLSAAARNRALGELALGNGDVGAAVKAFERALPNTRRWESRLSFAEALVRAGDLARAEQVLRTTADHPSLVYGGADVQGPGLWRQAMSQLAAIAEQLNPSAAVEIRRRLAPFVLAPPSPATR